MALTYAEIPFEIREISLKNKPSHMLQVSPKGTVPVLILTNGAVIDQSLDIMKWALQQRDSSGWLRCDRTIAMQLIEQNDGEFKRNLDRYKYAIRYPEHPLEYYREQGERFLIRLEDMLQHSDYLLSHDVSIADIAIFPFIRQFAAVDDAWFGISPYVKTKAWLDRLVNSELFEAIMVKYPLYLD